MINGNAKRLTELISLLVRKTDWVNGSDKCYKSHQQLKASNIFRWLEIERMSFRGGRIIFFPHFDSLISFASHQPWASNIIRESIDTRLTIQRTCSNRTIRVSSLFFSTQHYRKQRQTEKNIPGCTIVWACWKLWPLFQSQNQRLPLSPT